MPRRFVFVGIAIALLGAGPEAALGGGEAPGTEGATHRFRVIGHRAAAGSAPENTLPALARAAALGVQEVEVDLRLSRDGQLVLFHDGTLDEKTDLSGRVADHDLATLLRADIGSWFDRTHPEATTPFAGTRVIAPDAAFERYGDRFFWHLEIKGAEPELPARLVAAVRAARLEPRAMITSFDEAQLLRVRALAPKLPLCQLVHRTRLLRNRPRPDAVMASASAHGFAMVGIAAAELTAEQIARGHALGLEVRAFGVVDDDQLARVIALGADGATVDHPDRAFALLEQRRRARP